MWYLDYNYETGLHEAESIVCVCLHNRRKQHANINKQQQNNPQINIFIFLWQLICWLLLNMHRCVNISNPAFIKIFLCNRKSVFLCVRWICTGSIFFSFFLNGSHPGNKRHVHNKIMQMHANCKAKIGVWTWCFPLWCNHPPHCVLKVLG